MNLIKNSLSSVGIYKLLNKPLPRGGGETKAKYEGSNSIIYRMANIVIIALGAFLILLGIVFILISFSRMGKIKGGGVILIGPFPIIFGEKTSALMAILLATALLIAFLIFCWLGSMGGGWI